jgi:hypothetical protein
MREISKETLEEIMKGPATPIINVTPYNPHWCIFEKKNCSFADYKGPGKSFECKAPSDEEMKCKNRG